MYPVGVLLVLGLIGVLLTAVVNKIGPQVNPPQVSKAFPESTVGIVVWKAGDVWLATTEGEFSLFETSTQKLNGLKLSMVLEEAGTNSIFALVKEDLGPKEAKALISIFAEKGLEDLYIASPFDSALSNLRKTESRIALAPSPKVWVKWSLMTSLGGATLFDPRSEFLFVDNKVEELIAGKLSNEIKRRNLPVIKTVKNQSSIKY